MARKHMTSRELYKMLRMYEEGASAKAIGEAIGRTEQVVNSTLHRIRKQVNARDLPPETREMMQKMEQEMIEAWQKARAAEQEQSFVRQLFPFLRPRD